jgi:HSP20 family protein
MTTQLARFLDHNMSEPWDLLFKDLFNRDSLFMPVINTKASYPTDIYEDEKSVTIEVAAAGLDKDDIQIEEQDGLLSISYEKSEETKNEEPNYIQKGIAKRSFCLSWKFSDKFDLTNIEATMEKGILKINIPKTEEKPIIKNTIKIKELAGAKESTNKKLNK